MRALAGVQTSSDWATQVRAFDYRGRLTKMVLPREAIAAAGAEGSALLQRWLDAGLVRPAGLQVMLPEATCRCLPADLQTALRRRFGTATRPGQATPQATVEQLDGAAAGAGDLPYRALVALCRWIQQHPQHFNGHPAHTMSSPLYGVYRPGDLVAIALRLATRLLTRFTHGRDPKALWETWRARGWLRHDPDRFTLRLRDGARQRRYLALTWPAWEQATRDQGGTTAERSEDETHSPEGLGAAPEAERHAGRDAPPGRG